MPTVSTHLTDAEKVPQMRITPAARSHILKVLTDNPALQGLRLGVKKKGCSGFSYDIGFTTEVNLENPVVQIEGISILIDPKWWKQLSGSTLDYVETRFSGQLELVKNPNVKAHCGCGESVMFS
jgi:iron-sulfur cluster assembly protein